MMLFSCLRGDNIIRLFFNPQQTSIFHFSGTICLQLLYIQQLYLFTLKKLKP
jgi:hypothetical protein